MTVAGVLVVALVVAALVVLAKEWLPVDVVALGVVALLVLARVLRPAEAFACFAHEFFFILAAIFVLSGALSRTGIMDRLGAALGRGAGRSEVRALLVIMVVAAAASALLSNTSVTAILLPAVLYHARRCATSPSRFLIPLAYASMLGGVSTLIGTSTNLAANGFLLNAGVRPFGLFEFAAVGLVVTVAGTAYMALVGRRLLPHTAPATLSEEFRIDQYLSEIVLADDAPLVGRPVAEFAPPNVRVLAIVRGDRTIFPLPTERFVAGDVLIVKATRDALLAVAEQPGLTLEAAPDGAAPKLADVDVGLAEAIVLPRSELAGRSVSELRFRHRYGASVLAVYRRGQAYPVAVRDLPLAVGDVLLLHGTKEAFNELGAAEAVWVTGEVEHLPFRKRKGAITLGALGAAVVAGGTGWVPLSIALLVAVLVVVTAGVIRAGEAYRLVEWPLLVLIGGMTCLGLALQKSGAADALAAGLTDLVLPLGATATMAALALLTMALTQPLSNAAAALVVLPIALAVAERTGAEPRTFAVLVTLAASLSFITPFEPACLLVYAPGRYRFRDFVRVGLPLTAITLAVLLVMVPWLWG